jgi:hypothetical protein
MEEEAQNNEISLPHGDQKAAHQRVTLFTIAPSLLEYTPPFQTDPPGQLIVYFSSISRIWIGFDKVLFSLIVFLVHLTLTVSSNNAITAEARL